MNLGKPKNDMTNSNIAKESQSTNTLNLQKDENKKVTKEQPKTALFKNPMALLIIGVAVSCIVLLMLIITIFTKPREESISSEQTNTATVSNNEDTTNNTANSNKNATSSNSGKTNNTTEKTDDLGVGFQNFTADTNMTTSSSLDDPNEALKDIYGLSTRVDYEVSEIDYVTDFVNYTKKRGTWGGGIELYWLDAVYKDTPYIIQIPFKYYKELDDTGIVPVKMEVLRINVTGSTDGTERTIVSFMELDETTLKTLLKNKK